MSDTTSDQPMTVVHLIRHGEVYNPEGVLYGRLPDFHLSETGLTMADRVAEALGGNDITHIRVSPLERAQETARPLATRLGLDPVTDDRVIESANQFEGEKFDDGSKTLWHPKSWLKLYNPLRPSWGEPYKDIVVRMLAAIHDARVAAEGHEAAIVSHQLPVWTVRSYLEGRRLAHDPRKRQCTLASVTSVTYRGAQLVSVAYSEPAIDLVPPKKSKKFRAGA